MIAAEMKTLPDPAGVPPPELEQEYPRIRGRLVRFFSLEHCPDPDWLADETIFRAMRAFAGGATLTGKLETFLFGIAKNIVKEDRRRQARQSPLDELAEDGSDPSDDLISAIDRAACRRHLRRCLDELEPDQRKWLLTYHDVGAEGEIKKVRKELAGQLGIDTKALTSRVLRLKERLEECLGRLMRQQRSE